MAGLGCGCARACCCLTAVPQVDQILANLCVNARDAIAGVGEISIQTRNTTLDAIGNTVDGEFVPGDYVRLVVSDNGCGFSVSEAQDGGMGLRVIRYRAGLIGAELEIDSQPGKGTCVTCVMRRYMYEKECR